MSEAYTATVIIERTIEIEVNVRVVPDEPATYWEPGCAGEAGIESFEMDTGEWGLTKEEEAEAIKQAIKQGPPELAPDDSPPDDNNYNHPF